MRILSIDAATKVGWCFGVSTERGPQVFKTLRLKEPSEPAEVAAWNAGPWLRDRIREFKPDVIVVEEKMNIAGQKSAAAGMSQCMIHGSLLGMAASFGMQIKNPNVNTVRKFMCGMSKANVLRHEVAELTAAQLSRLRRERTKEMVIRRTHQLGLLPASCTDNDIADAALQWGYWAMVHGNRKDTELFVMTE